MLEVTAFRHIWCTAQTNCYLQYCISALLICCGMFCLIWTYTDTDVAKCMCGVVAPLTGHMTCDSLVVGSIPAWAPLCSGLTQAT